MENLPTTIRSHADAAEVLALLRAMREGAVRLAFNLAASDAFARRPGSAAVMRALTDYVENQDARMSNIISRLSSPNCTFPFSL